MKLTEVEYLELIENSIKEIESINLENSWSYEKIIHSLLKIKILPIILFREPKGSLIFRSRINDGIIPFNLISEISIPNENFVLNYARANKPKQALFYGSENRPTSYLEFAMHLAKTISFKEEVCITIGAWELQQDLTFALVFNPQLLIDNEYHKRHKSDFEEFLKNTPPELRMGVIKFFEFIGKKYAEQAENNLNNYLVTCAYSNIIFASEQCDGIMYPSIPRGGDAFNVVIKKNTIENEALSLKAARMDKFVAKEQKNGKHEFFNIAGMYANKISSNNIEWNNDWELNNYL